MSEWWTYGLSDFLMFSARVYYRLFEQYNAALWPAHGLTLAAGLAMLYALARRRERMLRAGVAVLGAMWVWVAWGFLWQRYAEINWPAAYVAPAFALQGVLLIGFAWLGPLSSASDRKVETGFRTIRCANKKLERRFRFQFKVRRSRRPSATPADAKLSRSAASSPPGASSGGGVTRPSSRWHDGDASRGWAWIAAAGLLIFVAALLLYPAIAPLMGRGWPAAELFGLAPDPTAIGTLAILALAAKGWRRWVLMPIPLLWCLLSTATLWTMGAPEFLLPALGALAATAVALAARPAPSPALIA